METILSLLFKGNSSGAVTAVNELTEALVRLGKAGGSVNVTAEAVKKETAAVEKAVTESAKKTANVTEESDAKLLAKARLASSERIALAEREVAKKKKTLAELKQILDEELKNESLTQAKLLALRKKSITAGDKLEKERLAQVQADSVEMRQLLMTVREKELTESKKADAKDEARAKKHLAETRERQVAQYQLEIASGERHRLDLAVLHDSIASDTEQALGIRAASAQKAAAIRKAEQTSVDQANSKARAQSASANAELSKEIREKISLIALDQEQGRKSRQETAEGYADMLKDTRLYYSERLSIARAMSKLIRDEEKAANSNDPLKRDGNGYAAMHDELRIRGLKYSAGLQAGQTTAQFGRAMSYGVGMPLALGTGFSLREFGNFERKQGGIETSLTLGGEKNYSRQRLDKMILDLSTSSIGLPIEDIQDIALQGVQAGVGQEKLESYIKSLYKLKLLIPDIGTDELAEKFNKMMVSSGNDLEAAANKLELESARLATIGTMSAAGSKEVLSASTRISGGVSNLGGSTMLTYALAGAGTGAGIRPDAYSTQINKLTTMLLRAKESFKDKTGGDSVLQVLSGLVYGGKNFGSGDLAMQKRLLKELETDTDKTVLTIFEKLRSLQRGKGTSVGVYDALGIKGRDGVRSFFTLGNVQGDKTPTAFYDAAMNVDQAKVEATVQARSKETLAQYQKAVNEFRRLAIDLGKSILPASGTIVKAVESIIAVIKKLVDGFSSLSPAGREMVLNLVGFAVALGPVITMFGNLVSGASNAFLAINKLNQFKLADNRRDFLSNMIGLGATTAEAGAGVTSATTAASNASRIRTVMSLTPEAVEAATKLTGIQKTLMAIKSIGKITIQVVIAAVAADWLLKLFNKPGVLDTIEEGRKAFTETRAANKPPENDEAIKALEARAPFAEELRKLEKLGPSSGNYATRKARLQGMIAHYDGIINASRPTGAGRALFTLPSLSDIEKPGSESGRTYTAPPPVNRRTAAIDSAQDRLNKIGARLAAAQEAVAGAYADIDLAYEKDKTIPGEKQKSSLKSLIDVLAKVRLEMADATASMKAAQGLDKDGNQTKASSSASSGTLEKAKARRDNTKDILEFRKKMEAYDSEELEVRKKEIQAAKANLQEELKTLTLRLAGENDPLGQSVLTGLIYGKQREIAKKELFINQLAAKQAKNPGAAELAGKIYGNELIGIDVGESNSLDEIFNKAKREEIAGLEIQRKSYEEGTVAYQTLTELIQQATDSLRRRTDSEKAATKAEIEATAMTAERNKARRRQAEFELNASMIDPSQASWLQFRKSARFEGAMAIEPNAELLDQIINGNAPAGVGKAELFGRAKNPRALEDYISGMNASDRADELTQLMARMNLSVDAAAYSEGQGDSFSRSFVGQARQGVALSVKDSDKAGVLKTLAALLSEGYQASTGIYGNSGSINLETYMGTMSQLRDLSNPYGPKGVNVINDEMAKAVKAVVGVELDKTTDVPRAQRGQAIDSVEKYLNSLPRWAEIPTQLRDELDKTFKLARKTLAALDPRRIAARRAEGEIRGALNGTGRDMLDRLFNPIEGSTQTIGFGATRQSTRGADQQWSEFWKVGVKSIKSSLATGIWDGLIQPQLDSFVDRFSGSLMGFLGQWQGTIGNLLVGMSSLASVLGAGGKKSQTGALIGGALGFLAGSLIPGIGNMAGAQIGASMGSAYSGGGGIGGALTAGAGAYGGLNMKNLSRPSIGGNIRDLGDGTVVVGKSRASAVTGGHQVNIVQNIRNEDKSSAEFYNEGMIGSLERALIIP